MEQWYAAKAEDKGGYCEYCAIWCNPKREGVGEWGKATDKPWDYETLFYCGDCVGRQDRKHKTLHR